MVFERCSEIGERLKNPGYIRRQRLEFDLGRLRLGRPGVFGGKSCQKDARKKCSKPWHKGLFSS
jgi:hypothetical protein